MQMSGERIIAADRAAVWAALNDPEVLKACIPGCQEMEKTSDTSFSATVKQKVGPVNATFKGGVELSDIVEGESYRIAGEGKGGAAGFAKGSADVALSDVEEGTKLAYDVDAKVGGKLAQLGSRLIDGFAKKMADQFFDRFKAEVEGPEAAEPEADAEAEQVEISAEAAEAETAEAETAEAEAAEAAEVEADAGSNKKPWWSRLLGN